MNGLARGRWGMPGPVISDCYAIEMLADPTGHHVRQQQRRHYEGRYEGRV